ncbi:MAG: type secretion protein HrpB1 [Paraburkholderia sp.]|jgi:type III secretion protein HrpB1|nr:type secretion protein HrpB1 [Paraburkholderia sp.]MEA3122177.1 type secretion protein HrpB1 [Paraburkholderia sp.]
MFNAGLQTGEENVTYTACRDDLAGGLTKVLWNASQLEETSDFEDLLDAVRVLRPRWNGAGTVTAWRYVRRQAWDDARRILEDDDLEAKRSALHAALMAVCLFGLEDPLWHSYARTAADQHENAEAALIGNRLLERAEKTTPYTRQTPAATLQQPAAAAATALSAQQNFASSMMWVRA